MLILALRTDKPESELYIYNHDKKIAEIKWQAHRKLAETINEKIEDLLKQVNKNYKDIEKIIVFKGPGSFTGLRIGISVANALAYSLSIPVVATQGVNWVKKGITESSEYKFAVPEYGSEPHITQQKK